MRKFLLLFITVSLMYSCEVGKVSEQRDVPVIGILPFGDFSREDVERVRNSIALEFDTEVIIAPSQKIPERFFVNIKSPRYRADSIIAYLRHIKPDSLDLIIGFTNEDISVTKKDADGSVKKPVTYRDFGVFGYGYVSAPGAAVSSFRIKSKFYHNRLVKVALHEVGHNLGLPHCEDKTCLMTDAAEKISTLDQAGMHLCATCKNKVAGSPEN